MKNTGLTIIILLSLFALTQCQQQQADSFDWLLGKWQRTNETQGRETYEIWEKISPDEYAGIGFTLQNGDTIKQEKIVLKKSDGSWTLIVTPDDVPKTFYFPVIQSDATSFKCENPKLDFPKIIKYWSADNQLHATVWGNKHELSFEFNPVKE